MIENSSNSNAEDLFFRQWFSAYLVCSFGAIVSAVQNEHAHNQCTIIPGETGAQCRESEIPEVGKASPGKQPVRGAAAEGMSIS